MWKDFLKNVAVNYFATNICVRFWWKMELPSTIVKWIAAMMAYAMEPKHQWSASSCCWHALLWLGVNIPWFLGSKMRSPPPTPAPVPSRDSFSLFRHMLMLSWCPSFSEHVFFFSSTFVFGHVKYNRGLVLFLVLQIPWPFLVFHDLTFSCHFRKFQNVTCFSIFFDLTQFNRNKLWYSPKCVSFVLFNYSSLSYIILALSSAVTNLPNKTLIFHDFQGPKMKFHDFPGLENEILKFHDFPDFVFHDLYEHCNRLWFPEVWNESLRCER